MHTWDDPKDRARMARLTADLRTVEVELLSALCAADRIRLHYSPQDIARFGERHVLQRAIATAKALSSYFSSIAKHLEANSPNDELRR